MDIVWMVLGVAVAAVGLFFLLSFVCFCLVFYAPNRKPMADGEFDIPPGEIYRPYREQMVAWMKETRELPHEDVAIRSFDGLTLRGKYYEYAPGAPIELMLHGYRGTAERDLCGGVQRCFALGRSVLIVDQRASGRSDGYIITFGVREGRDCLAWVDFIIDRFGADAKIILTGISMGAATVMIAAGKELPDSVIGVLADCGYTSARDIIQKVIRQIHLPVWPVYPLIRWGGKLYGGFDVEEASPLEGMRRCRLPVIFVHGEADDYVPCDMSRINYEACPAPKMLFTVPGAGHGLSYMVDREGYMDALTAFCREQGLPVMVKGR